MGHELEKRLERARTMTRLLLCVLSFLLLGGPVEAAEPWTRVFEVGAAHGSYSEPYGDADFEFARLSFAHPSTQVFRIEVSRAARFEDDGFGAGDSYTRFLPAGIELTLGASGGTGDVLYPDHQIDASIGKSFLPDRKLVASILYTRSQSKQENRFDRVGLALEYRPDDHWALYASARNEYGDPGNTTSRGGSVDVVYGVYRKRYFGVGAEFGSVSYLLVDPTTALIDYDRVAVHATLQLYLTPRSGLNVRLEHEHNDFYDLRTGLVSYFREW
jgi:YaiO family outer membrane protein